MACHNPADTSAPLASHQQAYSSANRNIKNPAATMQALVAVANNHLERQDYITAYHVFDILQGISPPPGTSYNNNYHSPPPIKYHLEQAKALYQLKEYHSALQLLRPLLEFALASQHIVEHNHRYTTDTQSNTKGRQPQYSAACSTPPEDAGCTDIAGSNLDISRNNCYANNMSVLEESALLEALGGGNPSSPDFMALKELKVATKPATQLILSDELGGTTALDITLMPARMDDDHHSSQGHGPTYSSHQTKQQGHRTGQSSIREQKSVELFYLKKYRCEALRVGMNCSFQLGEPRQTMVYAEALLVILTKQLEGKKRELETLSESQPRTGREGTDKNNKNDHCSVSGPLVDLSRCSNSNSHHQQRLFREKLINIHQADILQIKQQLVEPLILKAKAAEFAANTTDAVQYYREALKIDPCCISAMDSIQRRHLLTPREQLDLIDELVFAPDVEVVRTVYRLKAYTQMMGSTANMAEFQHEDDEEINNCANTDEEYFVNGASSVLRARQYTEKAYVYSSFPEMDGNGACTEDHSHRNSSLNVPSSASPMYPEAEGIDVNNNDDDNSVHEETDDDVGDIDVNEGDYHMISNQYESTTQPRHSISHDVGAKERVTSASSAPLSVSTIRPSNSCAPLHHQSLQRATQHNITDTVQQHILTQTEMRPIKRKRWSPVGTEYNTEDDDDDEPLVDPNGQLSISSREQTASQRAPQQEPIIGSTRTTFEDPFNVTNTQPPVGGWRSTAHAKVNNCEGTNATASQKKKPLTATPRGLYVKIPLCTLVGASDCPLDGVPLIAILNHKARVELAQNNLTAMITTTEHATKLYPHDREAMCLHLLALVDSCSTARLFELGHELQRTRPYSEVAMYAIGCYYYSLGEQEKAGKYFGKATDLDASFAEAWVAYGHCYAKLEEGERALLTYRRATALFPGLVEVRALEGLQLTRLHNDGAASLALLYAREKSPGDPLILNESGVLAMREGALVEARELLETAVYHILTLHCNKTVALREYNKLLQSEGLEPLFVSSARDIESSERKGVIRAMSHWVLKAPAVVLSEYYDIILFNLAILYRRLALFNDALGLLHLYLKGRAHAAHAQTAIGLTYHLKGDLNAAIICYHESLAHRNDPQCRILLERAMSEEFSLERGSNGGCGTKMKIDSLMARRRGTVTSSTTSCFMKRGVGSYGAWERDIPSDTNTTFGNNTQHFNDPMATEGSNQACRHTAFKGYQPQYSSTFNRRPPQTPSVNRSEIGGDEVPHRPYRGSRLNRGGAVGSYPSTMDGRETPSHYVGSGKAGSHTTIRQPCFSSASLARSSLEVRGVGVRNVALDDTTGYGNIEPSVGSSASSIPTFTTRLGSSSRGDNDNDCGVVIGAEEEDQVEDEYDDYSSMDNMNYHYHSANSPTLMYVPSDSNDSSICIYTSNTTPIDYSFSQKATGTSNGVSPVAPLPSEDTVRTPYTVEVRPGQSSDLSLSASDQPHSSFVVNRGVRSNFPQFSTLRPPPPLPQDPGSPIGLYRPPPPFIETTATERSLDLVRPAAHGHATTPPVDPDADEDTPSTAVPRMSTGGKMSGRM